MNIRQLAQYCRSENLIVNWGKKPRLFLAIGDVIEDYNLQILVSAYWNDESTFARNLSVSSKRLVFYFGTCYTYYEI